MKSIILILLLSPFFGTINAQEILDLKGEVDFPWINAYSAYGFEPERVRKALVSYEHAYKKAKRRNELSNELCLYELVKREKLLYAPYVSIITDQKKTIIVYMDSAAYAKTQLWNYNHEDLERKQQFLLFEAKGYWLGENAYLLTEFIQLGEVTDSSRSKALSKFAMDVYRK